MDTDSIDRVFTSEETRFYRAKVVLDRRYARRCVPGIAPVYSDGCKLAIGFALVVPDGDRVLAELTVDYACEERLLAETKASKVYAHAVMAADGDERVFVDSIVLSLEKPADDRIRPLGEPVL